MNSITYPQLIQNWTEGFASNKPFTLSPQFFSYSEEQNHEDAAGLMRYVFEEVLGWTPYDVQNHCSKDVIDILGLRPAYRALMWPATYDSNGKRIPLIDSRSGYGYVAALLYPNVIRTLGKQNLWIMEYNAMASGRGQRMFRVDDFLGNDGYDHARLLLNHYLINNPDERFESIEDVYHIFANQKTANRMLKKAKLLIIQQALFKSPLEYLHASLPDDGTEAGQDHMSYDFYRFENMLNTVDSIEEHKHEIMERYRTNEETVYSIAKDLNLDEEVLQAKIGIWNESIVEQFKGEIIMLHKQHVPSDEIAKKNMKLPKELINTKLNEWEWKTYRKVPRGYIKEAHTYD